MGYRKASDLIPEELVRMSISSQRHMRFLRAIALMSAVIVAPLCLSTPTSALPAAGLKNDRVTVVGTLRRFDSWAHACLKRGLAFEELRALAIGQPLELALLPNAELPKASCVLEARASTASANYWFKSPESLESTITEAYGLELSEDERWLYLRAMHRLLGGGGSPSAGPMLEEPNELYVLAAANLSGWLAPRLIEHEAENAQAGIPYLFSGLGYDDEDDACYADADRDWCDALDGVGLGDFATGRFDASALTFEQRKRLMHNIRDIGDMLLVNVGPEVSGPSLADRPAPEYLLDDVLLVALQSEHPDFAAGTLEEKMAQEMAAWAEVIDTILLSGAFFLDLPQ